MISLRQFLIIKWLGAALVCFYAVPAFSYWEIIDRPIETRPYSRTLTTRFYFNMGFKIGVEGSGLTLKEGDNPLFNRPLTPGSIKELEFQLGYLVAEASIGPSNFCSVALKLKGEEELTQTYDVPLRSIHPTAHSIEEMGSRYDFLMPAFKVSIPAHWTHISANATLTNCASGTNAFFDPKIWQKTNDQPARRLVLMVADSVGDRWFKTKHRWMPKTESFFSGKHGFIASNVVSPSANTKLTTDMLVRQRFASPEEDRLLLDDDLETGLVPSFLNAGYDTYASISNFLLISENSQSGFRNLYQIDASVDLPLHRQSDEFRTKMVIDWINRHPDHNALVLTWSDITHAWIPPPRTGHAYDASQLPYLDSIARSAEEVDRQGRALSYLDEAHAPLLNNPHVAKSDVMFFSDHGLNFDTLLFELPMWPRCFGITRPNNNNGGPYELLIFAGIHTNNPEIKRPGYEAGTLDWIYTLTKLNHPKVDTTNWAGRLVTKMSAKEPILSFTQEQRNAMRLGDEHYLWTTRTCGKGQDLVVLNADEVTPAAPSIETRLKHALSDAGIVPRRKVEVTIHQRSAACKVRVLSARAQNDQGEIANEFAGDIDRWIAKTTFYVNRWQPEIEVVSEPAGCAEVRLGPFRRRTPTSIIGAGLDSFVELPLNRAEPITETTATIAIAPEIYRLVDGKFEAKNQNGAATSSAISADLKGAMKAWGYIQDE